MGANKVVAIVVGIIVAALFVLGGVIVLGLWVDQCQLGNGDSLNVKVVNLTLLSKPTDNVFLGWESLFGKPSDEISVHLESGLCKASNEPREIKQQQTITFGDSLSINSFLTHAVTFWLSEDDGGFEGKDDYSQKLTISKEQLAGMRQSFEEEFSNHIYLDYQVTVKGANIFQENKWFGFIAENLCINAVDFVGGPWAGFGRKLAKTALASKFKKLAPMKSSEIARLYKTIGSSYQDGLLTKETFFKAVMTYQFRAGVKAAVKKPVQRNIMELVKEWALNKTMLDEKINAAVQEAIETGIYIAAESQGLELYQKVNEELDKWSSYFEKLTDSVEFCLSEVLPPSKDALYHVYLTVTK